MEKPTTYTFADAQIAEIVKGLNPLLETLTQVLDWGHLGQILDRHYRTGKQPNGRNAYPSLMLFRMLLVSYFNDLSDEKTELHVKSNLCFRVFVGMGLADDVPDHSTLCRFRNHLVDRGAFDELLAEINAQLKVLGICIKKGTIVDATLTDSAANFKDNNKHDPDAAYVVKNKKTYYGYKAHVATDTEGLVQAMVTTAANEHDSPHLVSVLDEAQKRGHELGTVHADKGYEGEQNQLILKARKAGDGIMRRLFKNRDVAAERLRNIEIQKIRYKVERTFGSWKRWFNGGRSRYKGMDRVHGFHCMMAIAYNLKRLPNLLARVQ